MTEWKAGGRRVFPSTISCNTWNLFSRISLSSCTNNTALHPAGVLTVVHAALRRSHQHWQLRHFPALLAIRRMLVLQKTIVFPRPFIRAVRLRRDVQWQHRTAFRKHTRGATGQVMPCPLNRRVCVCKTCFVAKGSPLARVDSIAASEMSCSTGSDQHRDYCIKSRLIIVSSSLSSQ